MSKRAAIKIAGIPDDLNLTPAIFQQVFARSYPIMESYQSDLAHDLRWFQENPEAGFIHITTKSGTHLYPMPVDFGANKVVPYLFGRSTPREIAHGHLGVLQMFDRRQRRLDGQALEGELFQMCEPSRIDPRFRQVRQVTGARAVCSFREAYDAACKRLDRGNAEGY